MSASTKEKTTAAKPPAEAVSRGEVAVLAAPRLPYHELFKERFNIDRPEWKALTEAIFPGAKTSDAIALALSYCKARKLDPFKKMVHIVPVWDSTLRKTVETVWPGIAEHRVTATRTGQHAGNDPATFGQDITHEFDGANEDGSNPGKRTVTFPEWCQLTVWRLVHGARCSFPGPRVYWLETYARRGKSPIPNDRWQKAPYQMVEKCAEAAALRRAFPEEFGDEPTVEEIGAWQRREDAPPDKPTRAPEPEAPREEPFLVVNLDHEDEELATPELAVERMIALMGEAAKRGREHLEALGEQSLGDQLKARGFPEMAQGLSDLFGGMMSKVATPELKKPEPDGAQSENPAPQPERQEPRPEPAAPPAQKAPEPVRLAEPPTPFNKRGVEWSPWVEWFKQTVKATPAAEIADLMKKFERQLNFIAAYRTPDHDAIQAALADASNPPAGGS